MKYFISDTHFSHTNILKFEEKARNFHSIGEHDEYLIRMWNETVKHEDEIIHMGDLCFKAATSLDKIMPRLNGKKTLLFGNHDPLNAREYLKYFDDVKSVICDKKNGILFSHFPVHPSQLEWRFKFNVHGHMHSHKIQDKRYLNISVENTGLKPISHQNIIQKLCV